MVEQLRVLGYPRLVSMENFRTPNFKLIAELLEWIVHRYDAQIPLPLVIDTEQERTFFIKSAAYYIFQKARIKLNPKKLYMADGYAAQEVAVVVRNLYEITRHPTNLNQNATIREELQKCRQLALEIPNHGATLHDLLAKEMIARTERNKALSFSLSLSDSEKAILQAIEAIQEELAVINHNLQNISSDEAALDAKIERRKKEYEQQQKRLAKLQSFRPQSMDEYEKYEMKLKQLYNIYVLKFRNLTFLKDLQNKFDHAEQQRNADAEQNMRNTVECMRAQELVLREAQLAGLDEEVNTMKPKVKGSKIFGNMIGAGIVDDDDNDDDDDDDDDEVDDDDNDENDIFMQMKMLIIPVIIFHTATEWFDRSEAERNNGNVKKLDISSEDDF
ncbi:Clusterin-associated protein 1 [Dirofilaria immitis]|nr:Clusterin-associated protein 1 [Dirofilaria immitis]